VVYKLRLLTAIMDIHNYKRRFDRTIERLNESDISKTNKKILLQFKDSCICENISYGKIDAYLFYLMKFTNMLQKAIEQATKEDIMKVISELNQTNYSEETKVSFRIAVRKIYKMIRDTEDYPPEVKWLKTTIAKKHKKIPEELLTEEEIQGIIRAGKTVRDKTLLSTLAESGCRVGEVGTLKIKNVFKKRIYLMKQILEGKEEPKILGKCRYCNENFCDIKEGCPFLEIGPLGCEIKDYIELVESPEFTSEIEALKKKYGMNFEFYTAFNILCPRKFCLREISNKEEKIDIKNSAEKAYFSNLVYEFIKDNKLFLDDSNNIKNSVFNEFRINKYFWFKDKTSIYPDWKIKPYEFGVEKPIVQLIPDLIRKIEPILKFMKSYKFDEK